MASCAEAATPNTEATPTLVSAAESPPAIPTIAPTAEPTATPIIVPAAAVPATVGCTRGTVRTEDEIAIGALYPLSNPQMMANGFAMLAATNLAIADINERGGIGGKTIRAVIYDSASDPAQGALFAERLITLDCVTAIVGIFHSDVAIAVKDVAVQYHVPVIFADPYADEVTADWAPEIFRIAPTHSMLIETMGEWLNALGDYNRDGERLAVVIAENTEFGRSRLQRFEETLPQVGVKTVGFPIDLPSDDFSPVIARIVALDNLPDAIFLYLHNGNVMSLAKQLIDAGIGPERNSLLVTTSKILDDQRFWQEVPNGDFLIAMQIGPWPSTITQMGQSFAMRFQQYFHRWPEGSAFEAYDAVWLIADAIGRADSLVPNAIIDALEKTDITLAAGHYNFPYGSSSPPDAQGVAPYLWHQWPTPPILYLQYTETNQLSSQMQVIWPPAYSNGSPPIAPKLKELIDQIGLHR
ncbi:MAG: ABC transporter substrate-binding protein [Caldilineaceae bacterium]|nr:ABC transporter substrate-binding protein [Caldilineaceae bacterium]